MSYRIDEDGATVRPEYISGILIWMALLMALLSNLGRADEFRAVVVTEQESAALCGAKARADEAQAAFTKLREATEARYRERLNGSFALDWSTDFRVIAERHWLPPSNFRWLDTHPLYQPGGWGSVTIPTTGTRLLSSPFDMTGDTGVLWSLNIPSTLSTGPVKSPLVFK